jgi:hypothetical protein
MSYIILRGRWCDVIVRDVHDPTEDIIDYIVTCMGVRATKITGSSSDDWIY